MSGIAQFVANRGVGQLREWMDIGYGHIQKLDAKNGKLVRYPKVYQDNQYQTLRNRPSGGTRRNPFP